MTEAARPVAAPAFHLLAKPSGATCNIDCAYCFFLSKAALYPDESQRMSQETLEVYIRQLLESHRTPEVVVAWQGGEPTLMKLEFFERAVELVEKYRRPGQAVQHTFQTNGILLDDDWCAFFKKHDFLVGLSVDGPRELHDAYRVDRRGRGTFDRVMDGWRQLRRHKVDFNILCTVNAANERRGRDVYRFFRDQLKAQWVQFIPIVERASQDTIAVANLGWSKATPGRKRPLYTQTGDRVTDRSVGREQYGRFLVDVFEEWVRHDVGRVTEQAIGFIDRSHKAGKPFFLWYNTTAMHFRTHCAKKHEGKSGQGPYNDVMVAHDENIGKMLAKLDELGIADDTIVMYSTDNGPHYNSWPDAGISPFRSEKNTNWEGGWRVPAFVRWPKKFKAGTVLNGIVGHQDWLATFLAAAGEPNVVEKLLKGYKAGEKTYKVHIDGFNMLPYLTGEVKDSPRQSFFYISDDGDILAIRHNDWKAVLMEQRAKQMDCWVEPFVPLRVPKIFNLRRDPFERADENSNTYWDWMISHAYLIYGMQALVAQQISEFVEFPPRQKPASFNLDAVLRNLQEASSSKGH